MMLLLLAVPPSKKKKELHPLSVFSSFLSLCEFKKRPKKEGGAPVESQTGKAASRRCSEEDAQKYCLWNPVESPLTAHAAVSAPAATTTTATAAAHTPDCAGHKGAWKRRERWERWGKHRQLQCGNTAHDKRDARGAGEDVQPADQRRGKGVWHVRDHAQEDLPRVQHLPLAVSQSPRKKKKNFFEKKFF
jgi:hypothetical protein